MIMNVSIMENPRDLHGRIATSAMLSVTLVIIHTEISAKTIGRLYVAFDDLVMMPLRGGCSKTISNII